MPRECGHQSPGQQFVPYGCCPLCDLDAELATGDLPRKYWRQRRPALVQWMRENGRAEWPCDEHEPSGEEVALASFCCGGSPAARERCARCGEMVDWHAFPDREAA